ncbi:MAG TPA: hypothetical protein VFJ90_04570 [Candidatus Didemnitutus sp.]|nr:hypothetical protein [Candidatus Didemnitutus sp.]
MNFQPASPASVGAFVALCVAIVAAFLTGVRRSERHDGVAAGRRLIPVTVGLALWLGLLVVAVRTGFVAASPMPRLPIFFGGIIIVSALAGFSPVGRWLAGSAPLAALVGFQAFRLPLELILHHWAAGGTIPGTMTWTGQNWDIVTGVTALVAAMFANRSPASAWIANVIGIGLLVNVARVALMSSPLPFAWPVTPPLLLAFHAPYALIAPVCVGGAAFGHVVLTRALLARHSAQPG